jgi:predicted nucleic acid-binding protein
MNANIDRLVNTDFLIDRWRNGESSAASAYSRAHMDDSLAISWVVKAEFLRIAEYAGQDSPTILEFLARYPTHWPDEQLLSGYARLNTRLRQRSLSLCANDLWIAASALRLDVPLVTRARALHDVPGIKLEPY